MKFFISAELFFCFSFFDLFIFFFSIFNRCWLRAVRPGEGKNPIWCKTNFLLLTKKKEEIEPICSENLTSKVLTFVVLISFFPDTEISLRKPRGSERASRNWYSTETNKNIAKMPVFFVFMCVCVYKIHKIKECTDNISVFFLNNKKTHSFLRLLLPLSLSFPT